MRLNKQFVFFAYLLESYAKYKDTTAGNILGILDEKKLTGFIYNMYELYHTEAIENAFRDIDSLIATGQTAW